MKAYTTSKGFPVLKYDETLNMVDQLTPRGWYRFCLYDTTRGMNIGTSNNSQEEAFFVALKYYQERLLEIEGAYKSLKGQVDAFVVQFVDEED